MKFKIVYKNYDNSNLIKNNFKIALSNMFSFINIDEFFDNIKIDNDLYIDTSKNKMYKHYFDYKYVIDEIDIINVFNIKKLNISHIIKFNKQDDYFELIDILSCSYKINYYDLIDYYDKTKIYFIVHNNEIHAVTSAVYHLFFNDIETIKYEQFIRLLKMKQLL